MQQSDAPTATEGIDIRGPDDAPSIVFVHGAIFAGSMWAPQRDELATTYQVLTFDLPGHGARSEMDFDFNVALELLDSVVTDHVDGECLLVGLSLGGYLVTEYASQRPENVDGIVLSGCSANPVGGMGLLTRATGGISRLATRSNRLNDFVTNRAGQWVRKRDITETQKTDIIESGFAPKQFGNAGPYLAGHDFRAALASYPGPSLILNGERDVVMRRGETAHAEAAQQATVENIDNVGHIANLHRPEAYTAAVRTFLTQQVFAQH